jgi:O-antigen biosynthesis protein
MRKLYIKQRVRKAAHVAKHEGVVPLTILALQKVEKRRQKVSTQPKHKIKLNFLAHYDDILRADWSIHPYVPSKAKPKPPYVINWVMSPPGKGGGGGHQNMFRFIAYLAEQGHTCNVYLYSVHDFQEAKDAKKVFNSAYPKAKVSFQWLKGPMQPADAVFATGWETAYPVFNDSGKAKKFYFIQDFEPYFYPLGSEYVLAENTYRMNFYGITAGPWLSEKLNKEYGMQSDFYNFGTDTNLYRFENTRKRKEVFFYARPVTVRRGFELGIMALQLFHEQRPNYKITLAGWDVSDYSIPFPYLNLKSLTLGELSDVYNKCAAGLVISLTNMSLLPLELPAAGVIPVVTDGPNNTKVNNSPFIKFAHASPDALAQALVDIVDKQDLPKYAKEAAGSVKELSWERSCQHFEEVLRSQL